MPGVAVTDTEVCLKTGANPKNVSACDGPDHGNFGFLDFTLYGNDELGASTVCQGGGTDRLERNIAAGIDHSLVTTNDLFAANHTERDGCLYANYSGGVWTGGEIFDADIIAAPHFGWVPLLLEPTPGPGTNTATIAGFMPIYIQTAFWGCNATGCDLEGDPGRSVRTRTQQHQDRSLNSSQHPRASASAKNPQRGTRRRHPGHLPPV